MKFKLILFLAVFFCTAFSVKIVQADSGFSTAEGLTTGTRDPGRPCLSTADGKCVDEPKDPCLTTAASRQCPEDPKEDGDPTDDPRQPPEQEALPEAPVTPDEPEEKIAELEPDNFGAFFEGSGCTLSQGTPMGSILEIIIWGALGFVVGLRRYFSKFQIRG